ncbi:MAG TPA: dihydrodipicolinate synthase family protein, partial [Gemmatimonadaceae bacterium]|nr:dihydrodipicolinate synthase family protein [Gemmatimonadaceae bacterium]
MAGSEAQRGASLRAIRSGCVIPAHPLALTSARKLDERHQRALTRYYVAAGAGGVAVGVHTTQFAIRDAQHGLLRPVLELVAETARASLPRLGTPAVAVTQPFALVAGICGATTQAVAEAELATSLGYDAGLISLAAMRGRANRDLLAHCRAVADIIPLVGFYLQPAVGGIPLDYAFWREFAEIPNVVAVKIAPFDRYRTIDVVRAIGASGRDDIALYTGNDDNIVGDLVTPFPFGAGGIPRRIIGGLLGQWAVWTRRAVELLDQARAASESDLIPADLLRIGAALTDANAAVFDVRNGFAGCIAGIHEVLRRQGLMRGTWCLDPHEQLSPGQSEEIDRVIRCYPDLTDDDFVATHLDRWLA